MKCLRYFSQDKSGGLNRWQTEVLLNLYKVSTGSSTENIHLWALYPASHISRWIMRLVHTVMNNHFIISVRTLIAIDKNVVSSHYAQPTITKQITFWFQAAQMLVVY